MKKCSFSCIIVLLIACVPLLQASTSIAVIENKDRFDTIVRSDTPSVIVFTAQWCAACQDLETSLQKVAANPKFKHVVFATINADANKALARQYKLHTKGIPIMLFMQGGVKKHVIVGAQNEEVISAAIKAAFPSSLEEKLDTVAHELREITITASKKVEQKLDAIVDEIRDAATKKKADKIARQASVATLFQSSFTDTKDMINGLMHNIKSGIENMITAKVSTLSEEQRQAVAREIQDATRVAEKKVEAKLEMIAQDIKNAVVKKEVESIEEHHESTADQQSIALSQEEPTRAQPAALTPSAMIITQTFLREMLSDLTNKVKCCCSDMCTATSNAALATKATLSDVGNRAATGAIATGKKLKNR